MQGVTSCPKRLVCYGDVELGLEEYRDDIGLCVLARTHQRCPRIAVCPCVRIGALAEEIASDREVAEGTGEVEGGLLMTVSGVEDVRVELEERGDAGE